MNGNSTVLTISKLTKVESDDPTFYKADMKGQYVHSKGGVTSIVDIKVTIESEDKDALRKVGEAKRITISPINASLDDFSIKENQE